MSIRRLARRLAALGGVTLIVAACSTASGAAPETLDAIGGELQATTWILDSYAVDGTLTVVPVDQYADADFRSQRVTGVAGCNEYNAVYQNGGRLLLIGMTATLRRACDETTDAFGSAYLALLDQSRYYGIRADTLVIRGPDLAVLLVFNAAPANPLLGSWIVDSYASAPNTLIAPLEGTELTAVFGLARVGGSSGCNTYDGPYTTNGTVAAIGPLATTRMACAEDVMEQETAFLAALQGVGRIQRGAQTIELQDLNGGTLVKLRRPSPAVEVSPSPSTGPTASPGPTLTPATPSASPSVAPSASPTPSPTPTPTPTPTPAATPTPAPTVKPPASVPPTATCTLSLPTGLPAAGSATVVYPADWNTVTAPPAAACRYFDPEPITVPADPSTLTTAVMIKSDTTTTYDAALSAATNPTAWNVLTNESVTVSGLPAHLIEATSSAGSPGVPEGSTRYGYLINVGGRPAWIETIGTVGDATYTANTSVVDLMAAESTITAP